MLLRFGENEHLRGHLLCAFKCRHPEPQPSYFRCTCWLAVRPATPSRGPPTHSRRPRGLGRPRAAAVEAWPPRLDHLGAGAAPAAAFLPTNVHSAAGRAPPAGLYNPGQPPPAAHAHFPPRMKRTPAPARLAAAAARRTPGGLRAAQKEGTESPRKAGAPSRTSALRTRRMRRGVSRSGPSQIT